MKIKVFKCSMEGNSQPFQHIHSQPIGLSVQPSVSIQELCEQMPERIRSFCSAYLSTMLVNQILSETSPGE